MFNNTNGIEKKRVAIYCRVSTNEQVLNGNGLEIQKEALLNYVKLHSERYVLSDKNIYIDEGKSGACKEEKDRPELYNMFRGAERGEFEILLVWKIDRFFRKTLYLLEGVEALSNLKVGFISITQPFDTTQAFGNMMLQMMGIIAELERELIKERTQAGILTSMKKGKWGRGNCPYGYKKNKDGFLEINEEEAETIKLIFNLLVKEGYTLNRIVNKLNSIGVDTSSSKGKLGEKRKNNLKHKNFWHRTSVQRIALNKTYTGILIQNRYIKGRKDKEKIERPKNEWIINDCPRIIEKEIFIEAQKQLEKNSRYSKRNKKQGVVYMLSTLLYDKETNYKFSGYLSSKNTINYRLDIRNKSKEKVKRKGISGNKIENTVWNKIKSIISHPRLFLKELEVLNKRNDGRNIEKEIEGLELKKWKLKKSTQNLLRLSADCDDVNTLDDLKEMIEDNRDKIASIEKEIEELGRLVLSEEAKIKQLNDLSNLSSKLVGHLEDLTYEEKTEICRLLIDKITLDGKKLEIILLIPNSKDNKRANSRLKVVKDMFKDHNKFISGIKKDPEIQLNSKVSELCYYNGRERETRTHNPTVPNRVRYQLRQFPSKKKFET